VPFGTCEWIGGEPRVAFVEVPKPELRHEQLKWFVLLRSFCYLVPEDDPAAGKIFVAPGADAPVDTATKTFPGPDGRTIVVPPSEGGRTDLASVPSFMWWLVASYGNHTRAALLHDALVEERPGVAPAVPRTEADRLLLAALRDPGQQRAGAFRHWLMWAAASVFGTMRPPLWLRPIGLAASVFLTWGLLVAALFAMWSAELTPDNWKQACLAVVAVALFLIAMGTSWRAGANITSGWLPTALMIVPVLVLLYLAWSGSFDTDQSTAFWLLLAVTALVLLGHVWGLAVDRTLRWRLWPTSIVGLPIAGIPVALIFLSILMVWLVDLGASISASFSIEDGKRRGFRMPRLEPYRRQF
jgi:hypothetical protein